MGVARDGILLAVGTLTRVPVPTPRRVDRVTAGVAMSLAPMVGLLLAVAAAVPMTVASLVLDAPRNALSALLVAALTIAWLAWLTRGLHLDGLADLADALGSGTSAAQALDIARRPDIGPFGTLTLILVLLLQCCALALLIDVDLAATALATALVASRLGLTWACTPAWKPARPDGMGATVAASTSCLVASLATVAVVTLTATSGWLLTSNPWMAIGTVAGVLAALAATWVICRIATSRLGGITGDVLGAATEVSGTASLIAMVLAAALF